MSTPATPNEQPAPSPHGEAQHIEFSAVLSVRDAAEAAALAQSASQRIAAWIVRLGVGAGLATILALACFSLLVKDAGLIASMLVMTIAVSLVVMLLVGRRAYFAFRADRFWKQRKGMYVPTRGRIDADGIHVQSHQGITTVYWTGFRGFRHSPDVAVLFWEFPGPYLIVARAKFSKDEDWEAFLKMVETRLARL